ncbi:MAG: immunoglobulin domain-containing protein [Phycisphaeraceae bacterium]|nr:MAG: immunoglobulin domain-containing protein [Phycisphaeraceae bacterium]
MSTPIAPHGLHRAASCLAAVALLGLASSPAAAQLDGPLVIYGNDTNTQDLLGASVDIDGGTIIAGAPGDTPHGNFSGSAYLFDVATGAQLFKVVPSDGASQAQFGASVSISGDRAIVGAPNANKVYVFDVQTGQQVRVIQGPGPFGFGQAVDLDGTTAIIGSPFTNNFLGAAYLYDIETGQPISTFGGAGGNFGIGVSIRGDRAAVGAPNGVNQVRLYDTGTGALITTLQSAQSSGFGEDLDIQFGQVVVGAPATVANGFTTGRVATFDAPSGTAHIFASWPPFAIGSTVAVNSAGYLATGTEFDPFQGNPGQGTLVSYGSDMSVSANVFLSVPASSLAAYDEYVVVGLQGDPGFGSSAGAVNVYTDARTLVLRFLSQPESAIVSEGGQVALSVVVGGVPLDYQWRRNGTPLSDGGNISGARTDTLTITDVSVADIATYDCVVSDSGPDSITSNPAVIAVIADTNPCLADLNDDGLLDLADVTLFVSTFLAGCP